MLNEFVDKVVVYQADKSSGERVQKVDIYLNFIGKFDILSAERQLSQQEIEADEKRLAKKLEDREYFRRRYLDKKEEKMLSEQAKVSEKFEPEADAPLEQLTKTA
jgi:flagellar motility protein MotE (MotC chaperone)